MIYYTNPANGCLVEQDEEPPHELDVDAKNIAILIACSLKSNIFSEIYPMRKMVIDGSNTSGFQRTMMVSQGGFLDIEGKKIGVQSICLEEDAARLLADRETERDFSLDRLGVPLVEIALEPVSASPSENNKKSC
jgi:glutamyl-tRNA(Gln) amidotransferase subunit E